MPVTRVTPKYPGSVDHIQHSTRLCAIAVPAAPADARPLFLSARVRNSPANSMGVIVKNNEKYNAGEFRLQRQGRAPRAAANNNEYQCGQQWPGSWTGTFASSRILFAPRRRTKKARRGLPSGHTNSVSIS
jgi:hypothetical protein